MPALAEQQARMLRALFDWPAQDAVQAFAPDIVSAGGGMRGLKAYQTNGHVMATRALQAAYPVVAQWLGEESFADLARAMWHAHPPLQGDLARWGGTLSTFLAASDQLQDEPCLPDVARLEWALHCCALAADGAPDPASLALLTTHDPDTLTLLPAPGSVCVASDWPIVSIVGAHQRPASGLLYGLEPPDFATVGRQLRAQVAQGAVVWRDGLRPRLRQAQAGEIDFLQALRDGMALAPALDAAPALDFGQWLPVAVQGGLLLAVQALAAPQN